MSFDAPAGAFASLCRTARRRRASPTGARDGKGVEEGRHPVEGSRQLSDVSLVPPAPWLGVAALQGRSPSGSDHWRPSRRFRYRFRPELRIRWRLFVCTLRARSGPLGPAPSSGRDRDSASVLGWSLVSPPKGPFSGCRCQEAQIVVVRCMAQSRRTSSSEASR